MIKIETLQRTIKDCNLKVEKAQRDTRKVLAEKRQLQSDMTDLRREGRGSRETQKRSLDRSNSPIPKRHSPSPATEIRHYNTLQGTHTEKTQTGRPHQAQWRHP